MPVTSPDASRSSLGESGRTDGKDSHRGPRLFPRLDASSTWPGFSGRRHNAQDLSVAQPFRELLTNQLPEQCK